MSTKFINPLKEFENVIVPLSEDFPNYLKKNLANHGIKLCDKRPALGKEQAWIDWEPNCFSFTFDFDNNEEIIKDYFRKSMLSKYTHVIMEFGYQAPIAKIPINVFISYWYELVIIAGYESVVITEDGLLYMEFIRRYYELKSNFPIWTGPPRKLA